MRFGSLPLKVRHMPRSFNYQFPYASQRMPVMAKNIVATSQPLAAQAGLQMLQAGGNAVDAAIAAAITLTVVEPTSNGIGSDGFCILWDGKALHGLNASGRSPAGWTPEYFADKYPNLSTLPVRGWDSVTVPGAVSQWMELSTRFGKLPFEKLFEFAIRLCARRPHGVADYGRELGAAGGDAEGPARFRARLHARRARAASRAKNGF